MSNDDFVEAGQAVYDALLARIGEGEPNPRLHATRRAVELLGDPQRAYPIIHITGTNGKTSTSRIIESILRAYGLRTGLYTSPHLTRFNERIIIDGEPIGDQELAANWADIQPYIAMVDAELDADGQPKLTFFEVLTVLAFACFADAPVDVVVLEVGMGGEWDSTNVADGQVAVFTPISLDHTKRLGNTVAEIARTKSGIIKPAAAVVTAKQDPSAMAELVRATELTESTIVTQGEQFAVVSSTPGVGGQSLSIRGIAGSYDELFLPLLGEHQAQNAALAIAAVESFLGRGSQSLSIDILAEGLATSSSPGRLQVIGIEPTVLVDAAHNPAGAQVLAAAVSRNFHFDELSIVLGILADKDAAGIVRELAPLTGRIYTAQSASERAINYDDLAELVRSVAPAVTVIPCDTLEDAVESAREWSATAPLRAVLATGSITVISEVIEIATRNGWKAR
ncbi:MAG: folylpolyglutamate synthase/dihydrofolate synthase family protein [Microbacteriaceae bacterium]